MGLGETLRNIADCLGGEWFPQAGSDRYHGYSAHCDGIGDEPTHESLSTSEHQKEELPGIGG